jgi:hypothetical protein
MNQQFWHLLKTRIFWLLALIFFRVFSVSAQQVVYETGNGANSSRFILNFKNGETVVFMHRWNGMAINAKTLLESVVSATGGAVIVTESYLTPFADAMLLSNNVNKGGLVVHYQGSYALPYINGIRWNGPGGVTGADYDDQFPDNWWHLWVQGPAHIDQSLAYPDSLPSVDLAPASDWFFGEFSGLADLTLTNGGSIGLVYGSANLPSVPVTTAPTLPTAPAPPSPTVLSTRILSGCLEITWQTVANVPYLLKSNSDLDTDNWAPIQSILASSSTTTLSIPIADTSGREFFRLEIAP